MCVYIFIYKRHMKEIHVYISQPNHLPSETAGWTVWTLCSMDINHFYWLSEFLLQEAESDRKLKMHIVPLYWKRIKVANFSLPTEQIKHDLYDISSQLLLWTKLVHIHVIHISVYMHIHTIQNMNVMKGPWFYSSNIKLLTARVIESKDSSKSALRITNAQAQHSMKRFVLDHLSWT